MVPNIIMNLQPAQCFYTEIWISKMHNTSANKIWIFNSWEIRVPYLKVYWIPSLKETPLRCKASLALTILVIAAYMNLYFNSYLSEPIVPAYRHSSWVNLKEEERIQVVLFGWGAEQNTNLVGRWMTKEIANIHVGACSWKQVRFEVYCRPKI